MANPAWAPLTAQVAAYIPGRTVAVDTVSDALAADFGTTTRPTAVQVASLIVDACAWVVLKTGDIITTGPTAPSLALEATAVAAVRSAGMVELSYPVRTQDLNTADRLLAQADKMRDDLTAANKAAGASDAAEAVLLPTGSFPTPPTWGDNLLI